MRNSIEFFNEIKENLLKLRDFTLFLKANIRKYSNAQTII